MKDKSQPTIKVGLVKPKPDTESNQSSASLLDTVVETLGEPSEKPQKQDIPPQKVDTRKKVDIEQSPTDMSNIRKLGDSDELKQSMPQPKSEKSAKAPANTQGVEVRVVGRKRATFAIVVALASFGLQFGLPTLTGKPATESFVLSQTNALGSRLDGVQVELKGYTNQNVNAMKSAFEEYQSSLEDKGYVTSGVLEEEMKLANGALEQKFVGIERKFATLSEKQIESDENDELERKNIRAEIGSIVVATSDAFSEASGQVEHLQGGIEALSHQLSVANDEIVAIRGEVASLTKKLGHSEVERDLLIKVEGRLGELEAEVFELSQSSLSLNQGELERLEQSLNSILQEIELKLLNRY